MISSLKNDTQKNSLEIKEDRQLDTIHLMKDNHKKMKSRGTMKNCDNRIDDYKKNLKTKMIIDFDHSVACSIKSLTIQINTDVKPTSKFFNSKMLMFTKVPLMSFVYDLTEKISFPNILSKKYI